jgi:hypothetical protein
MLFTPLDGDLPQGVRSECKLGVFDAVPVDGVSEVPERYFTSLANSSIIAHSCT